jgi:hypothetical protein
MARTCGCVRACAHELVRACTSACARTCVRVCARARVAFGVVSAAACVHALWYCACVCVDMRACHVCQRRSCSQCASAAAGHKASCCRLAQRSNPSCVFAPRAARGGLCRLCRTHTCSARRHRGRCLPPASTSGGPDSTESVRSRSRSRTRTHTCRHTLGRTHTHARMKTPNRMHTRTHV